MEKIIIENRTDLNLSVVFMFIHSVISCGRISGNGKQYCYLTTFNHDDEEYHVVTDVNKRSDRFVIYQRTTKGDE